MANGSVTVELKTVVLACVASIALTWFALTNGTGVYPPPQPEPDRPILAAIAKIAKSLLWIAVFADPPERSYPVVQQTIGEDGYPTVSHSRSL